MTQVAVFSDWADTSVHTSQLGDLPRQVIVFAFLTLSWLEHVPSCCCATVAAAVPEHVCSTAVNSLLLTQQ